MRSIRLVTLESQGEETVEEKTIEELRMLSPEINNAYWYAVRAHKGQKRKDGITPYIAHPIEVAGIVSTMTTVPSVIAAALLHDTVEDTPVHINDIARIFGGYVADLVADESENKRKDRPAEETWRMRKEEGIRKIAGAGSEAKMISLADKLSNLRAIKKAQDQIGDQVWTWFHNSNVKDQAWYYCSMRDQYIGLKHFDAWKEYAALIRQVFGSVLNTSEEPETTDFEDVTEEAESGLYAAVTK